ncbi:DUF2164 domain-containing protein [Ornithinibacillus gellani]|uniref:DUF2164 domain-containing protein n=1 Tax=Ornithinibacillus gellani TaxID=2293253 RepID=UPI000F479A5C|nr:DUF2164 domain-containing protein [Ornithinibacillus gellani]TQS74892.1 DUF2164 domain-containing protein [Ornithinibacillus gellani]
MKQQFNISKEQRDVLVNSIMTYYEQERGEELGNLEAGFILDFFIEELAPIFYNLAVEDCHTYLMEKLEDVYELKKI